MHFTFYSRDYTPTAEQDAELAPVVTTTEFEINERGGINGLLEVCEISLANHMGHVARCSAYVSIQRGKPVFVLCVKDSDGNERFARLKGHFESSAE